MNRHTRNRSVVVAWAAAIVFVFAAATPAQAQREDRGAEIKKKMADISRLMRESERLLLEMTKIDRLVEQQRRVVEELKTLKPPETEQPSSTQAGGEAKPEQSADQKKRSELVKKQKELRRKLEELFENQHTASKMSVSQLEDLLRNLPTGGGGSSGMPRVGPQFPGL